MALALQLAVEADNPALAITLDVIRTHQFDREFRKHPTDLGACLDRFAQILDISSGVGVSNHRDRRDPTQRQRMPMAGLDFPVIAKRQQAADIEFHGNPP